MREELFLVLELREEKLTFAMVKEDKMGFFLLILGPFHIWAWASNS